MPVEDRRRPTEYLPAERSSPQEVSEAAALVASSQARLFLDDYPVCTVIVDGTRQIVYANRAFLELAGSGKDSVLGRRPGEALGCERCDESPEGCGTSLFCRYCGAAKALEAGLRGADSTEECLLRRRQEGREEPLELMLWSRPLRLGTADLILLAARDVSQQKRREALERVFYHDIANTATSIAGALELLGAEAGSEEGQGFGLLRSATEQLFEEIASHRALKAAEEGTLSPSPVPVDGRAVFEKALGLFGYYLKDHGIGARLEAEPGGFPLVTDPVILRRVLVNMIKNAVEASGPGETIVLGCRREGELAVFSVGNGAVMGPEARSRVFQRSFSTKGPGRGLGTYGMRLLGEEYLGGRVSFSSAEGRGTVFSLRLRLAREPLLG